MQTLLKWVIKAHLGLLLKLKGQGYEIAPTCMVNTVKPV